MATDSDLSTQQLFEERKHSFLALGLSERAAEVAARGRDGSSLRSASGAGRSSSRPEQGNALKLLAQIEEEASVLVRRGVEEQAAVKEAAFAVFRVAPDDTTQEWVAQVIQRRWPALYGGSSSSNQQLRGRRFVRHD